MCIIKVTQEIRLSNDSTKYRPSTDTNRTASDQVVLFGLYSRNPSWYLLYEFSREKNQARSWQEIYR